METKFREGKKEKSGSNPCLTTFTNELEGLLRILKEINFALGTDRGCR